MGDLNDDIVVFKPFLTFEAPPVNGVFMAFIEDVIDALEPGIRQIPCLDELNFHLFPPFI
jgi:hypothetical protein